MKKQPYRPSNSSDGESFMAYFCDNCIKSEGRSCEIIMLSMCFDVDDPEYPKEWLRNTENFNTTCTAFERKALHGGGEE